MGLAVRRVGDRGGRGVVAGVVIGDLDLTPDRRPGLAPDRRPDLAGRRLRADQPVAAPSAGRLTSVLLLAQPVITVVAAAVLLGSARRPSSCSVSQRCSSASSWQRARVVAPSRRSVVPAAGTRRDLSRRPTRRGVSGRGCPRRARAGRRRSRRRRPTRGRGRPAAPADPRRRAGPGTGRRRSWVTPGSPRSTGRDGHRRHERLDDVGRHPVGRDGPQGVEVGDRDEDRPAGLAVPGRPEDRARVRAVRLDQRRDGLGSDPGHPRRPESAAVVSRTSAVASSTPRTIWPTGTALDRRRQAVGRLGAGQRRRDGADRVGRHDDDRQRPAGPGDIDEPTDPRLARACPRRRPRRRRTGSRRRRS